MLFTPSLLVLWALPVLQCLLLVFFSLDSILHFWYNYGLCVPAVVVGFLGGGVYVHGFKLLSQSERGRAVFLFSCSVSGFSFRKRSPSTPTTDHPTFPHNRSNEAGVARACHVQRKCLRGRGLDARVTLGDLHSEGHLQGKQYRRRVIFEGSAYARARPGAEPAQN